MQHKKSKAVAFTNSTNLGHGLSPSLCWPSVDGELQLLPSETLELASVSFFLGFGERFFCLGYFFIIFLTMEFSSTQVHPEFLLMATEGLLP